MRALTKISCCALSIMMLSGCVKQEDVALLEMKITKQEEQIQTLNQELGKTSKQVEDVRPEQADLWSQVQSMRVLLATIEGKLEDMNEQMLVLSDGAPAVKEELAKLSAEVSRLDAGLHQAASELALDLEIYRNPPPAAVQLSANGTTAMTNGTMPVADVLYDENGNIIAANTPDGAPAPLADEKTVTPAQESIDPAQALYDAAITAFKERRYEDAHKMWAEFETSYTDNKLIPNAIFWQGEAFYQLKDYARAILAYQKVLDNHKKSSKYRSAMLKQGISFLRLGKKKAGAVRLNELIKKFPKSPEAARAKKALK